MSRNSIRDRAQLSIAQDLNYHNNTKQNFIPDELDLDNSFFEDNTIRNTKDESTTKWGKFQAQVSYLFGLMIKLFFSLLALLGSFLFYISGLFSFVFVIIILFVFFISFITSYIMSPIYLSLSQNYLELAAALLQVVLTSPLVAFFIYFFFNSIMKVGDVFDTFSDFIGLAIQPFQETKRSVRQKDNKQSFKDWFLSNLGLFIFSLVGISLGAGIFFITFLTPGSIVLGCIIFLPTVLELICLLAPTYLDFLKLLFMLPYSKEGKTDDVSQKLAKIIQQKVIKNVITFDVDSDSEDEKKVNQETQTFITEKGQFSNKIGYSEKYYDFEVINSIDTVQSTTNGFIEQLTNFFKQIRPIFFMKEFINLYAYGRSIARDQYRKRVKCAFLWIFTILNAVLAGFDFYRSAIYDVRFFWGSTAVRLFLIPLYAYFHIIIQMIVRAKDKVLRVIIHIASIFTVVIVFAIIAIMIAVKIYQNAFRIPDFTYSPLNESIRYINPNLISHPICMYEIFGIDALSAYAFALGVYDVIDNPKVFNESMKQFFGPEYADEIRVDVYNISDLVPFIIYTNTTSGTKVVAFRGFNSGPEFGFLIEFVANTYIIPFFSDLIPFMETLTDFWLETEFNFAHRIGRSFFDPTNLMKDYEEIIERICLEQHLDEEDKVLFTGISVGATFAKIVGIKLKKYSLSFLTLPIYNDFIKDSFDIDDNDMSYITNVYIYDSYFTIPEPEFATNIGLYGTAFESNIQKWCKSGVCEINLKKESNYPTFCLIAGICGKNAEFDSYCRAALRNDEDVDNIKDFVMDL